MYRSNKRKHQVVVLLLSFCCDHHLSFISVCGRCAHNHLTALFICFILNLYFYSLQVWDLRAGRLLSELREHTASVTEVVFHPHEFLLASGGADRRVLFWDLENFTLVSNSEPETSGIRSVPPS